VRSWFDESHNQALLQRLRQAGVNMTAVAPARPSGGLRLEGKTFVITGTLDSMSREEATEAIERLGGRVSSSVSGKTSFVVVGHEPGSKADRAGELGVETLDEAAFRRLIIGS
jgi:DNA ligase (NAD+)